MFRLFSWKISVKYCTCLFLLFPINYLFVNTYFKFKPFENYISNTLDSFQNNDLSKYFEEKRQRTRPSSFRTILHNQLPKSSEKTSYLIYEFTRHRQFCRKQSSRSIYASQCPYQNCQFTCDSKLINQSDALLMLYSQLKFDKLIDFAKRRNSNQIWLLWHDEPYAPATMYNKFLFNWTITYRSDSEVSIGAYGISIERKKPMDAFKFEQWVDKNYINRHDESVWFVSNCNSKGRLQYYQRLKKYFPISAFGKCILNENNQCNRTSQCELDKLSTSKLYLAFESTTLRRDYITEKFWRSLSLGTIPIVLGPKRQDYERVAPPNSFIYAGDYRDPQALGAYLSQVVNNRDEYEKYHRWRINYETYHRGKDVEPYRFCELCYRLNKNRDRIWYNDINQYFLETDK